ncbi:hypothetical protein LguiB_001807 [Lonicera macranthoides]
MVAATVISSMAFQAALNPPGGLRYSIPPWRHNSTPTLLYLHGATATMLLFTSPPQAPPLLATPNTLEIQLNATIHKAMGVVLLILVSIDAIKCLTLLNSILTSVMHGRSKR